MILPVFLTLVSACLAFPSSSNVHSDKKVAVYTSDYVKKVLEDQRPSPRLSSDGPAVTGDIQDLIKSLPSTAEAAKILEEIGLRQILQANGPGPFTILVPSNDAIKKFKQDRPEVWADKDAITDIIKAGIVAEPLMTVDIGDEITFPTLVAGAKLRFNVYNKNGEQILTANGARLVARNHRASNGWVHVVDRMIYPTPAGDAIHTMSKVTHFSTLVKLIADAGLTEELTAADHVTVLAPTNQAFASLPAGSLDSLKADTTKLRAVLKYHVIPHSEYSAGLRDGQSIPTMEEQAVTVKIAEGVIVLNNQATVIVRDAPVNNGVIQTVDKVLIPPEHHFMLV